jgi:hypothetical protein
MEQLVIDMTPSNPIAAGDEELPKKA